MYLASAFLIVYGFIIVKKRLNTSRDVWIETIENKISS